MLQEINKNVSTTVKTNSLTNKQQQWNKTSAPKACQFDANHHATVIQNFLVPYTTAMTATLHPLSLHAPRIQGSIILCLCIIDSGNWSYFPITWTCKSIEMRKR
jgi:hypothetical protein